jgi:cytochrome c
MRAARSYAGRVACAGCFAFTASLAAAPAAAAARDNGDAARGRALYEARCGGCPSLDADRIGPRYRGLLGRRAGTAVGFDDSPALRASAIVWGRAILARWLADAQATIPGQRMNVAVRDPPDRADLIAYLATAR